LNIGRLEVGGAKVVLWDLGGAAALRSIWDKYFAEAHVLVCVWRFCFSLSLSLSLLLRADAGALRARR
jgi:hypothetical protein